MPHHQSAKKRARQTQTRTAANRIHNSKTRTVIKSLRQAIAKGDKTRAGQLLPGVQSLLARLVKRGVIKSNTAARKTSRLSLRIAKL